VRTLYQVNKKKKHPTLNQSNIRRTNKKNQVIKKEKKKKKSVVDGRFGSWIEEGFECVGTNHKNMI
jgi:hypothetical protein